MTRHRWILNRVFLTIKYTFVGFVQIESRFKIENNDGICGYAAAEVGRAGIKIVYICHSNRLGIKSSFYPRSVEVIILCPGNPT